MIIDEDIYLEHHGVKGMKWGVRRTARLQKRLDRTARVASGKASRKDKLVTAAAQGVYTKKGANKVLQRGANEQAKMAAGKKKVTKALLKIDGIRINELQYHKQGDANAKMDTGQRLAVAALATYGAMQVGSAIARR